MGEEDDEEDGEEEKAKGKRGNHRPAILEDEALAGHGMGAALKVSMWETPPITSVAEPICFLPARVFNFAGYGSSSYKKCR